MGESPPKPYPTYHLYCGDGKTSHELRMTPQDADKSNERMAGMELRWLSSPPPVVNQNPPVNSMYRLFDALKNDFRPDAPLPMSKERADENNEVLVRNNNGHLRWVQVS
jgi:hypothetical protein